jgi:predicted transcriptional regulator of viral defense system
MSSLLHQKKGKQGPLSSQVISKLHERGRSFFRVQEVAEILGSPFQARSMMKRWLQSGLAMRMNAGLYRFLPFDPRSDNLENSYPVARELVFQRRRYVQTEETPAYYISHSSAFAFHHMLMQPELVVHTSTPFLIRSRRIFGTEFFFHRCKLDEIFGLTEVCLNQTEQVKVSDLERTLLDGLRHPRYCGGFSEVAKAIAIKRGQIHPERLLEYATRLGVGAVSKRLGFLMDLYDVGNPSHRVDFSKRISLSYELLDPELPEEGKCIAKWRLKLNFSPQQLQAFHPR